MYTGGSGGRTPHTSKYKLQTGGTPILTPVPKIDFPKFDGTYPRAWILKCKGYFELIPNIPDQQKIFMAAMHFEGKASLWYQNLTAKHSELSWEQFIDLVSARFEELKEAKIIGEFNKLKMMGNYADYVDRFEELRACLLLINKGEFSEEYFIASFVSGLGDELQSFIRMFNPSTLPQAIELGRNQLLTLEALTKKLKGPYKPTGQTAQFSRKPENNFQALQKGGGNTTRTPFKLLTAAEMEARREKKLCYNCDETYAPGHRCKQRISYLIMTEEEEHNLINAIIEVPEDEDAETHGLEEISLAFSAMSGEGGPTTMRVMGEVGGHRINILIDSGSTLSFISEATARALQCKVEPAKPLLVKVANGSKMVTSKLIKGFKWNI